jgi:hypothetical protein
MPYREPFPRPTRGAAHANVRPIRPARRFCRPARSVPEEALARAVEPRPLAAVAAADLTGCRRGVAVVHERCRWPVSLAGDSNATRRRAHKPSIYSSANSTTRTPSTALLPSTPLPAPPPPRNSALISARSPSSAPSTPRASLTTPNGPPLHLLGRRREELEAAAPTAAQRLARQPRLTDPRLPAQRDHATTPTRRVADQTAERREL